MKEKKLIIGFSVFLILVISIGFIGIFQIHSLSKTIQELGKTHLPRQRFILQMKINNTLYAMGVRNYIFWRISKYLQAASIASDMNFIEESSARFSQHLDAYAELADSDEQQQDITTLRTSIQELGNMGIKIIELADATEQDKNKINKLLMAFENKSYNLDDFLTTLSNSNLKSIEFQLELSGTQKDASILILIVSLCFSGVFGVVISVVVYKSLKKARERREVLVQKMIRIEEEERKNLSRQIHDQLSQDLSALKIYLELIEKDISGQAAERKDKIEKSRKILANLIDRGHNISEMLRPPELDDLGLIESIGALVREHQEITGRKYKYHKPATEVKLAFEYTLTIYRVAQESLTNIVKHARAENITIALQKKRNAVSLSVSDDGVGFNHALYLTRNRRRQEDKLKLGLQGLRERVELLGGKLSVKTAPGKGTKIEMKLSV
ncbi:MAG: hypothetical protein GY853_06535 [PVC group bacterium]|nr:hypothetical protein [PVC group bacterium]